MASQRKLTDNQVHLLKLIYKFRFVTVNLLTEYRNQGTSAIHNSLERLLTRELIGRRHTNIDIIDRRPARYYLSSKGIKELKKHIEVNQRLAHSYYKNKSLSENYVQHCLNIFQVYNNFRIQGGDRFMILTNAEMADYDQFQATQQDLYLQDKESNQYLLNIYESTQRFVVEKHIKQHIEHSEDIDWPGGYPDLLLACPSSRMEEQLVRRFGTHLEDFEIYLTTNKALLDGQTQQIWTDVAEPEKIVEL